MKTAKASIYEYMQRTAYRRGVHTKGLKTTEIASALHMQRSNVSAVLNALVKIGMLEKTATRPVYYRLTSDSSNDTEDSCFTKLIGYQGSLRHAIQLAKAAVLYPQGPLPILISAPKGCGTTTFASLIRQFAIERGVMHETAPYVTVDGDHYTQNTTALDTELFGTDDHLEASAFAKARDGILFIDHFEALSADLQSRVLTILETRVLSALNNSARLPLPNLSVLLACDPAHLAKVKHRVLMTIELPALQDRPMRERYACIRHFFTMESMHSNRFVKVTKEVVYALLLTTFIDHIKELEWEIKTACAKAYLRVVDTRPAELTVCLNDLNPNIQQSLLKQKEHAAALKELNDIREIVYFDYEYEYPMQETIGSQTDMYDEIKQLFDTLSKQGIQESGIRNNMQRHIERMCKEYHFYDRRNTWENTEQLAEIVDRRIIDLVSEWLSACERLLKRRFSSHVFYGLCLHIHTLMTLQPLKSAENELKTEAIIRQYPLEYRQSEHLSKQLETAVRIQFTVDEIALIALFLIEAKAPGKDGEHPVLLYIMHGNSTASSLQTATNLFTQHQNAYGYDLASDIDNQQAMRDIKEVIVRIDQGKGVIVIYDMGSIKTMIDLIADEIDIKLRCIHMPVTMIGIEVASRCAKEQDIDYVYHMANLELNRLNRLEEHHNPLIITLCHTGEGGARQLKHYLDQYSKQGMKTIALSISNRSKLIHEVLQLRKTYHVHAFVGTYDPKLFGIPFIPIKRIFACDQDDLDRVLMFEPIQSHTFDYNGVYAYLEEQFKYVSIAKLKTILPGVIDELSGMYPLQEEQRVGLFMHIACLIEQLISGIHQPKQAKNHDIINRFHDDYRMIQKALTDLEKNFQVIIDDREIAVIIMMIKQI